MGRKERICDSLGKERDGNEKEGEARSCVLEDMKMKKKKWVGK